MNLIGRISFETMKEKNLSFTTELIDEVVLDEFFKDENQKAISSGIITIELLKKIILRCGIFKELKKKRIKYFEFWIFSFRIQEYISSSFFAKLDFENNENEILINENETKNKTNNIKSFDILEWIKKKKEE